MSDDDSNDSVQIIEGAGASGCTAVKEGRPLMTLLRRLTTNHCKQNTVLTNAQIIYIMKQEFDIEVRDMHELELDIYVNVVKRFLKDWPQWDTFDHLINRLQKKKSDTAIEKVLENNYLNLKVYLKVQLDATKPLARQSVINMTKELSKTDINTSDVVLQILCTRQQLNELIYDSPEDGPERNIFHVGDTPSKTISVISLSMEAILHWWKVQVSIEMKNLSLTWSTCHELNHIIVNKKNGPRNLNKALSGAVQKKDRKRTMEDINKRKIYTVLDAIVQQYTVRDNVSLLVKAISSMIKGNLELYFDDSLKVPATYRSFMNKYPYYRQLRKETKSKTPTAKKEYDLYLEETLCPRWMFDIVKVCDGPMEPLTENLWLTVECKECNMKFTGVELLKLKEHFDEYHGNEPDWTCTNCKQKFSMMVLAHKRWRHDCPSPSSS